MPVTDEPLFHSSYPEFVFAFGNGKRDDQLFVTLDNAKLKHPDMSLLSCTFGFNQFHATQFVNEPNDIERYMALLARMPVQPSSTIDCPAMR
jgi:hypothetical protein